MPRTGPKGGKVACEDCAMYPLCRPLKVGEGELDLVGTILKRQQPFKRGESLYRKGDPFKSIYAICSGSVKVSTFSEATGEEHISGFCLPGELIGAEAINQQRYPRNATALENSKICEIPFHRLEEFGVHMPALQNEIIRLMASELLHYQWLAASFLGRKSAEEKLAAFLLNLSLRLQERGFSGTSFRLSMTRGDIGNYFGLAKETVSRMLTRFQADGLISAKGSRIQIHDLKRLQAMTGDPPMDYVALP